MGLTAEQREVWDVTHRNRQGIEPSGAQTLRQAWNFAVLGFQAVCQFEGVEVPSEEDVFAELERKYGPAPPGDIRGRQPSVDRTGGGPL